MADVFESTPSGLVIEGFVNGVWVDLTPDTTEHSITISSAEPPFKPARLNVPLWRQSGGLQLNDFLPIRVSDQTDPASAYPRYFQGFALNQQQGIVGNINQTYDLDAVGLDWLLSNPPAQIIAKMPWGALPWMPEHPHIVGDQCVRMFTDGHMYEVTAATGDKMSGDVEPDFDTGTGAVTVDNDLEWTEIGSAHVTDVDVLQDLLPEYFGAEVTFTSPNVLCADVGYFEVQPGMTPQDAIKSLAERVSEFAAVSFPTWVALTPYLRSAIVEPITANGYGYLCIKNGTSGNNANIFSGHTTLGEAFNDGSTRWLTFIQTSVAPTWQIVTPPDNAAHTDPWTGNFVWYDANNPTHVPTLSIEYSDQEVEDATHKHLSDIVIHRNGASGYANEVHVFGRNSAYGFAEDTVAQGNVQRVISTSHFMNGDNDPDTNAALDIIANQLLGKLVVRETLTLESSTPLSTVVMQGGLRFGKVTMALLGLSAQRYPMTRVTMKMSESDGSKWLYEWGDPFRGDLDQIGTLGGTRRYPGDHTPPALVTWPADYVLQNTAEGYGLVTLSLKWRSGNEADLSHYKVRLRLSNEVFDRVLPDVIHSQQHITIPGLPENVGAVLKILAYDTSRNPKPPVTEANWSVSPPVTTAIYVASPPSALLIDAAKGTAGYHYVSGSQARPYFKWTASNPLPLYYVLRVWRTSDITTMQTTRVLRTAVETIWPYAVDIGVGHTASIASFIGGVESAAASVTFIVPAYTGPPAPVLVSVAVGVAPKSGGYAKVRLTSVERDGGGFAYAQRLTGDLTDQPIIPVPIPPDFDSPYFAIFNGLTVGAQYRFSAIVLDELGVPNPIASNTIDATIQHVPDPDRADTWDSVPTDDDGLRGQTILTGSTANFSWENDSSHLYAGSTTRKIVFTVSDNIFEIGPPYSAYPAEQGTITFSRKGEEGIGGPFAIVLPKASAYIRWYDNTVDDPGHANYGDPDAHIDEDEIFDEGLPADFEAGAVEYKWMAPADARSFRLRTRVHEDSVIGDGDWTVWFTHPVISRIVTGKQLSTTLDLDAHTVTLSGTGSIRLMPGAGRIPLIEEDDLEFGNHTTGGTIAGNDATYDINIPNGAMRISTSDGLEIVGNMEMDDAQIDVARFGQELELTEQVAPSAAPGSKVYLYAKTDGKPYSKNNAGVEYDLTASILAADKSRLDRIHTPVSKTATFTADLVSGAYLVSASGGAVVANLPAVSGNAGLWYFIKKTDSSTNTVTLEPSGAETIDGAANLILYTQDHAAIIYCDGATWWVFGTLGVTWRGHRINGTLAANGGLSTSTIAATRISKTAAFTAASETVYECDATSAAFTATLPSAASTTGRMYTFKKVDSSANKITIDGNSSETIDQIITYPLIERNQSVTIQSNGTNWNIIGQVGLILESDGTRWLGPEIAINFNQRAAGHMPWSADDYVYHIGLRGDWTQYLKRWTVDPFVSGTNDGSNYWNIKLYMQSTNVASLDTSAVGNGDWRLMEATSFSTNPSVLASHKYLEVEVAKTGSPGVIYMTCVLYVRMVYT